MPKSQRSKKPVPFGKKLTVRIKKGRKPATGLNVDVSGCGGYDKLSLDAFKGAVENAIPMKSPRPTRILGEIFPSGSPQDNNVHPVAIPPTDARDTAVQGSQTIDLHCVFLGEDHSQIFSVKVATNKNVSFLRWLIKKQTKPKLNAIAAQDLKLYQVDLSGYDQLSPDAFKGMVTDAISTKCLFPLRELGDIFPSGSPQAGHVQIVVVRPDVPTDDTTNNLDFRTSKSTEGTEESDDDTDSDSHIFDADDIRVILADMNYTIDFPLFGHPFVAAASSVIDDTVKLIKFVPEGQKEAQILQYLSGINSPRNHTIAGVRVRPVRRGHIILMPLAGSWLTDVKNLHTQLWSVAEQLIEAVGFMHEHGVAHLDLKPANILIPKDGGRLSIIDFHTSIRIKGVNTMLRGVVGTPGYLPPEVKADGGWFSALRADLWSCGKTLVELCHCCRPSADRSALLGIGRVLMNEDPRKRPMMSDVVKRMTNYKSISL